MFESPVMRKYLVIVFILLFAGMGSIPGTAQNIEKPSSELRGNWFFVGGDGPGNYTRIQDAINDSSDGDSVFVYSGVYYERIIIRKSICLRGESMNTTVIDAMNTDVGTLIALVSDNITISGFTLRFTGDWGNPRVAISNLNPYKDLANITISGNLFQANLSYGIWLMHSDFCSITQNIFYINHFDSICLEFCNHCVVSNNLMFAHGNTERGISLRYGSDITISNNSFNSMWFGINLQSSEKITISNNNFFDISNAIAILHFTLDISILSNQIDNSLRIKYDDNLIGVSVKDHCDNTTMKRNLISHCEIGVLLEDSSRTFVIMNTFLKNIVHARFYNTHFPAHWNQNYWGRSRILPKPIVGIRDFDRIFPGFIEFDWHPAQEPYDVGGIR